MFAASRAARPLRHAVRLSSFTHSPALTRLSARPIGSMAHNASLTVDLEERRDRKTSIICTVGPSTWSKEGLTELLMRGMNVLRLNFSHGSYEDKERVISTLREVIGGLRASGAPIDFSDGSREDVCAVAADTKGPEIRTGHFAGDAKTVELVAGQTLTLVCDPAEASKGSASAVFVDYPTLAEEVGAGQRIYIDDGLISLDVVETSAQAGSVTCVVNNDALLGAQKGVNIPFPFVSRLPAVTEQDRKDLAFAADQNVDFIFASFIRRAEDVDEVRAALGEAGKGVKIISKIENQEGCDNFDAILAASDGIMVARGDLGIEVPPQRVFLAQKMMISKCNLVGKPVICATQMLESMVNSPRPTRAEVSDVANAVLDGADCVMLSGETAKGRYPNEAVDMMSLVCREAEVAIDYSALYREVRRSLRRSDAKTRGASAFDARTEAIATSAVVAAAELDASALIVLTQSGHQARAVAKYRPACPVLAVTSNEAIANEVLMSRGVIPLLLPEEVMAQPEEAIGRAVAELRAMELHSPERKIVAVSSFEPKAGAAADDWAAQGAQHLIFI